MAIQFADDHSDMSFYAQIANPYYSHIITPASLDSFHLYTDDISFPDQAAATGTRHINSRNHTFTNQNKAIDGSADEWFDHVAEPLKDANDSCNAFTTTRFSNKTSSGQPSQPLPGRRSREGTYPLPGYSCSSSSLSPRSSEYDSACDEDSPSMSTSRKRGRSRVNRIHNVESTKSSSSNHARRPACVPHKQVERKYREGLNMEFERLRSAVPTLPQSREANVMGASKPSKGMVLAAAIEYINRVERERDATLKEIERLRGAERLQGSRGHWESNRHV